MRTRPGWGPRGGPLAAQARPPAFQVAAQSLPSSEKEGPLPFVKSTPSFLGLGPAPSFSKLRPESPPPRPPAPSFCVQRPLMLRGVTARKDPGPPWRGHSRVLSGGVGYASIAAPVSLKGNPLTPSSVFPACGLKVSLRHFGEARFWKLGGEGVFNLSVMNE